MGSGRRPLLLGQGQHKNFDFTVEINGLPAGSFTTMKALQADPPERRQPLPRLGDLWQHARHPLMLGVVVSICADGDSGTVKHQDGRFGFQTEQFRSGWRLILRPGVKVYHASR